MRETVRSVRHAADLRSHVVGHPWIAFGSAVALGYVATRLATRPKVVEAAGRQTAVPEVSRPATFVTTNGEQRRPLESQPQAPVRGVFGTSSPVYFATWLRARHPSGDGLPRGSNPGRRPPRVGGAPPTARASTSPASTAQTPSEAGWPPVRPAGPVRGGAATRMNTKRRVR